jgi:hypothetical protein
MRPVAKFHIQQSKEFEKNYVIESQPTKIVGLPLSMPAYKKWSFEYFSDIGGEIEVGLSDNPLKRGIPTSFTSLSQYCNDVTSENTALYMVGWPYENEKPDLNNDFSLPAYHPIDFIDSLIPSVRFRRKWIFIGRQGLYSDLHVDAFTTNAWLMVTSGKKTVRFLSPVNQDCVTPNDSLFDEELVSRLGEKGVEVQEMSLEPGEVGYVPSGWMHHVRNDTNTIMVTGNFSVGFDVFRFYPNFRNLLERDVRLCDHAYEQYVAELKSEPVSPEHRFALRREIARLQEKLEDVQAKLDYLLSKEL